MENNNLDKIIDIVRKYIYEDAPTMSVGTGENLALPPTFEPPVKKRKKYIYQKNSRKLWKM